PPDPIDVLRRNTKQFANFTRFKSGFFELDNPPCQFAHVLLPYGLHRFYPFQVLGRYVIFVAVLECYKVVIIWVLHKRHSHQSVQRDSKMPTSPLRDPNHSLTVRQHFLTTHLPEYFSIFTDNESTDIREQFTY